MNVRVCVWGGGVRGRIRGCWWGGQALEKAVGGVGVWGGGGNDLIVHNSWVFVSV